MREINLEVITNAVENAVIEANLYLPHSLCNKITECAKKETDPLAKDIFKDMINNLNCADELQVPICQDCGMAVVFAEIGQDVHFSGGDFESAINAGVAKGYTRGFLRKSIVTDPMERINSNDNTPAVIHTKIVPGEEVKLMIAPKGFGSENMSQLKMFNPTVSEDDIIDFVVNCVNHAGSKPCPPVVIGVGIGGDFEYCAYLAKKALCRDVDMRNPIERYNKMENKILKKINELNIGPQGFGGNITALACNIEVFGTHIAGLPVAVNVGCHVTRHKTIVI